MPTTITLVFSLLVAIVVLATIAARLRLPYAIMLVLGGLLLSFIPGLPTITLDPALILFLFLPPLIYSSAWTTSWREFRTTLRPILLLSVGLVLATTIHCGGGGPYFRWAPLAGRFRVGCGGLTNGCSGSQCDRQECRTPPASDDADRG